MPKSLSSLLIERAMNKVDLLMQQAVSERIFPGGVLLVSVHGSPIFFQAYGYANLFSHVPMTKDTIFDLASLTKPLATALAVLMLIQKGRIDLDHALSTILSEFEHTDKALVKLKHLLYHTSGLPDYRPYYKTLSRLPQNKRREALRECLLKEPLVNPIGKNVIYSDIGFMILAWVIEHVSGRGLDHFCAEEIYQPLELENLFFTQADMPTAKGIFAATEKCLWRRLILEGQVHDENAYAVGGVEGHAGLFGTADSIHVLLFELLCNYFGKASKGLFQKELLRQFFKRMPGTDKALGFDTPSVRDASCGSGFSQNSVGHLGFTGTSFWMDLERAVIVILLTNRVHPSRENMAIKTFRPTLHDAVINSLRN
jgi:CubicO group peptidase (beta-lactamase class C family)